MFATHVFLLVLIAAGASCGPTSTIDVTGIDEFATAIKAFAKAGVDTEVRILSDITINATEHHKDWNVSSVSGATLASGGTLTLRPHPNMIQRHDPAKAPAVLFDMGMATIPMPEAFSGAILEVSLLLCAPASLWIPCVYILWHV